LSAHNGSLSIWLLPLLLIMSSFFKYSLLHIYFWKILCLRIFLTNRISLRVIIKTNPSNKYDSMDTTAFLGLDLNPKFLIKLKEISFK
jgi:hypothetical protein